MVDAEVEPSLPRHLALPVAAGVIVHQLLFLRHPEQLAKLGAGLLELVCVVVLFDIVVLVVLSDDALRRDGRRRNEVMSWDMKNWGRKLRESSSLCDQCFKVKNPNFILLMDG